MKKFKHFTAKNVGDYVVIDIHGDIVDTEDIQSNTDVTPSYIGEFLDFAQGRRLEVNINSFGGDVNAGMAIYKMLSEYKNTVNVYIRGIAGSIASVIAMAGDNIYIAECGCIMIHRSWTNIEGNCHALKWAVDELDRLDNIIADVYMTKLRDKTKTKDDILEMMTLETWFDARKVIELFDVSLINDFKAVACVGDVSKYKNIPLAVKNMIENELKGTEEKLKLNLEKEKLKLMLEV
jgi:ATP-dependent protease ClpP protease subunit